MPVSTTLKLPEDLKRRLAPLAKSAGKTPHAWMIEALETQATLAEKRRAFIDDARAAEKEAEETGVVYGAEDVHRYIRARASSMWPTTRRSRGTTGRGCGRARASRS